LKPVVSLISAQQVWVAAVGPGVNGLSMAVNGDKVAVAGSNGTVTLINVLSGADLWRFSVGGSLTAGVGFDGHMSAVITSQNELVAIVGGQEVWRQRLASTSFTAPLVAGQRVFVLGADRSVSAYDANSGIRLWTQSRTGEPLVLRQSGVLLAVGDTLVVGLAGRMVGFNPNTGSVRWEVPLANPRGVNDIERMVDLVGPVSRLNTEVCARAFQSAVGCVDAQRGTLKWTQMADGVQGVHGDEGMIFGSERDGHVAAWNRSTGQKTWSNDQLLHRDLSAPLVLGRSVAVGDGAGFVHLLSREDGSFMGRLSTDGSAIVTPPALAGDTLLVLTRSGNLFAWRPQ
jgi:outer membrane assembly lipoprotein YfgL